MIMIDLNNLSFICPFCGHLQAMSSSYNTVNNGIQARLDTISEEYKESSFTIYTLYCRNKKCERSSVTAINRTNRKQVDILPQVVMRHYPDYIPEQIRRDYEEANLILESSPKAAATLLRRCLQGMIHDFWNIHEKNLNAEISSLKDKISPVLYNAIDSLRKIGNIGAHMEQDVNIIIDIEPDEAKKLLKLIELLFDKWYIARHDEEDLLSSIIGIADGKETKRKNHE